MRTRFEHVRVPTPNEALSEGYKGPDRVNQSIRLSNHLNEALLSRHIKPYWDGQCSPDVYACTVCIVEDSEGNEQGRGYAFCHATDTYTRSEGRRRSLRKAREKMRDSHPPRYSREQLLELAEMIRRA